MVQNLAGKNIPAGNGGVIFPSPNEWPVTAISVTGITNSLQATITAPGHGITLSTTASTPKVDFSQIKGMYQINGMFGFVTNVIDVNTFQVAIDTTNFYPYIGHVDRTWESIPTPWMNFPYPWNYFTLHFGGYVNITGGSPPDDPLTNLYA